jgi:hypothetical protein
MEKEIWRDIAGYEGYYQVSNFGRVRSLDKMQNYNGSARLHKGKILKPGNDSKGYLIVSLSKNNRAVTKTIHRLVAMAFLENQNNLPCVNHKDEDKENNFVFVNKDGSVDLNKSNLEWCTVSYNVNYGNAAVERGLKQRNDRNKSKLTAMYTLDGNLVDIYPSAREASRLTGIPKTLIYKCCKGENKTAKGFVFKYFNNN